MASAGQKLETLRKEDLDLNFTSEQAMLREAVRSLCGDAVGTVRDLENDPVGYDAKFWGSLTDMGLTGLMIPEAYNGSAMGLVDAAVVYEEFGRSLIPSPHLASSVIAAGALMAGGSDAQRKVWLEAIASGKTILIPAWLEPDRSSGPDGVSLPAIPDGNDMILNGAKRHVHFASSANRLVVLTRGSEGIGLFLVDPKATGVNLTQQFSVASDTQYRVDFDGVRIPNTDRVGEPGAGWKIWETAMIDAMVLVAAQAVGAAKAVHSLANDYAKERYQFDKPIGSFQSLSHYLADADTAIEGARVLVYQAAWARDTGHDLEQLAPMAKLFATSTFRDASAMALQIHGGLGFTVACDAQLYFRRAKAWQLNWYDPPYLEDLIATSLLA